MKEHELNQQTESARQRLDRILRSLDEPARRIGPLNEFEERKNELMDSLRSLGDRIAGGVESKESFQRINSLEKENARLARESEELKREIMVLKSEMFNLEERYADLDKTAIERQKVLDEYVGQMKDQRVLEEKLSARDVKIQELNDRNHHLMHQLESVESRFRSNLSRIESFLDERTRFEEKIKDLEEKVAEYNLLKTSFGQKVREFEKIGEDNLGLLGRLEAARRQIDGMRRERIELEKIRREAVEKSALAEERHKGAVEEIREIRRECEMLREELEGLREERAVYLHELDGLAKKVAEGEEERRYLREKSERLNQEKQRLTMELTEHAERFEATLHGAGDTKKELETALAEIEALRKQKEAAEARVRDLADDIRDVERVRREFEEYVAAADKNRRGVEGELQRKNEDARNLGEEVARLRKNELRLQSEIEQHVIELGIVRERERRALDSRDDVRARMREVQDENRKLVTELNDLRERMNDLLREREEFRIEAMHILDGDVGVAKENEKIRRQMFEILDERRSRRKETEANGADFVLPDTPPLIEEDDAAAMPPVEGATDGESDDAIRPDPAADPDYAALGRFRTAPLMDEKRIDFSDDRPSGPVFETEDHVVRAGETRAGRSKGRSVLNYAAYAVAVFSVCFFALEAFMSSGPEAAKVPPGLMLSRMKTRVFSADEARLLGKYVDQVGRAAQMMRADVGVDIGASMGEAEALLAGFDGKERACVERLAALMRELSADGYTSAELDVLKSAALLLLQDGWAPGWKKTVSEAYGVLSGDGQAELVGRLRGFKQWLDEN